MGFRERIARGALQLPSQPANLTLQHDRAKPLGLLEWQDDDDALRFRTELSVGSSPGPSADGRARSGLLRGASLEFPPPRYGLLGDGRREWSTPGDHGGAMVRRLSLVDDGAYPQSSIKLRVWSINSTDADSRLTVGRVAPKGRRCRREGAE